MKFSIQIILILVFCGDIRLCPGQIPDSEFSPGMTVEVDGATRQDCKTLALQQVVICNNIMDVLQLISQDPSNTSVEVIINKGIYIVEGNFTITRDVLLHGHDGHSVLIHLQTQGSSPPVFSYSLSFRNTDYVSVKNINFAGSNGVIGFDNVSKVEVSLSSFR